MIKADTSGADVLAEKLKGLPAKLQTKISRVILKEALKETGAREELTGYISTHFKAHTGIYRKSVSGIKSQKASHSTKDSQSLAQCRNTRPCCR